VQLTGTAELSTMPIALRAMAPVEMTLAGTGEGDPGWLSVR